MILSNNLNLETRLPALAKALNEGNLITKDFIVVEKNGIKWVWIRFINSMLNTIRLFFQSYDPWKAFRIDEIVKSLKENSIFPLHFETQKNLTEVIAKLEEKASLSKRHKDVYLKAIGDFKLTLKISKPEVEKVGVFQLLIPRELLELMSLIIGDFGHKLYTTLVDQGKASFSLSPISIVASLGMCLHTLKDIEQFIKAIGLEGFSEAEVHRAITATLHYMKFPKDFLGGSIEISQSFAHKPGVKITDSLRDLVKKTYDAKLIEAEDLQTQVNEWVDAQTNGKIKSILQHNRASAVFLNSVYLNLKWEQKFEKPQAGWKVKEFHCLGGTKAPVSMMTKTGDFRVYRDEKFTLLEIPYLAPKGHSLFQRIILPKNPETLMELEKSLTPSELRKYAGLAKLEKGVKIHLPKTKTVSEFELLDNLCELGLPLEINQEILKESISNIIQKTFISNDENGTEAAAVTATTFVSCMQAELPEPIIIDHSFTYYVMAEEVALFHGRVCDENPLVVDSTS